MEKFASLQRTKQNSVRSNQNYFTLTECKDMKRESCSEHASHLVTTDARFQTSDSILKAPSIGKDAVGSPVSLSAAANRCIHVGVKRFDCIWLNKFCLSTIQFNSIRLNSIQYIRKELLLSVLVEYSLSEVQCVLGAQNISALFLYVAVASRLSRYFSSESSRRLFCGAWLTSSSDGVRSGIGDEEICLTYLSRWEWCSEVQLVWSSEVLLVSSGVSK